MGTVVEKYLGSRGIVFGDLTAKVRASLRFHPRCPRPMDNDGTRPTALPAMLALVQHVQRGPVGFTAPISARMAARGSTALP